jgi:hypothetical protein
MSELDDVIVRLWWEKVEVVFTTDEDGAAGLWYADTRQVSYGVTNGEAQMVEPCELVLREAEETSTQREAKPAVPQKSHPTEDDLDLRRSAEFLSLAVRAAPDGLSLSEARGIVLYSEKAIASVRAEPWVMEARERRPDSRGHVRELIVLRERPA